MLLLLLPVATRPGPATPRSAVIRDIPPRTADTRWSMVLYLWKAARQQATLPRTTRARFPTTLTRFLSTRRFTTLRPRLTDPTRLHIAQPPSTHKPFRTTRIPPHTTRHLIIHVPHRSLSLTTPIPPPRSQALIVRTPSRTTRSQPPPRVPITLTRFPTSRHLVIRHPPRTLMVSM